MSNLESGSVAWVRLGQAWWPGTVTTLEKCPPEFVQGLRKTPVAVVKFFHENEFQDVHKTEHIYPYSCDRKEEFIRRGLYVNKNKSHGDVDLLRKFESDVVTAEKLTGGDMDILQTIGEVADFPRSSPELGFSSNSQSTHFERPQGCLPGEIEFGDPEGQTQIEANSSRMRSPHSNSKQEALSDSEAPGEQIYQFNENIAKEELVLGKEVIDSSIVSNVVELEDDLSLESRDGKHIIDEHDTVTSNVSNSDDSELTFGHNEMVVPLPNESSDVRDIPHESHTSSVVRDINSDQSHEHDESDHSLICSDPQNSSKEVTQSVGMEHHFMSQNRKTIHKNSGTNSTDEVCQLSSTAVEPDSNLYKSDCIDEDTAVTLPESPDTVEGKLEGSDESNEVICEQTNIGKHEFKRAPSHAVESHHADSVSNVNNGHTHLADLNGKSHITAYDGMHEHYFSQNVQSKNENKGTLGDGEMQHKDEKLTSELLNNTKNHNDKTPETCSVSQGNNKGKYADQEEDGQSKEYPEGVARSPDQIDESEDMVSEMLQVPKIDRVETEVDGLGKQLATQSSSVRANSMSEVDEESDSEPKVSSSGVKSYDDCEEVDDSVDDEHSTIAQIEHHNVKDIVEEESNLEQSSGEVHKSDRQSLANEVDISEAESMSHESKTNRLVQGLRKEKYSEAEQEIKREESDSEMQDETPEKVEEDFQGKRTPKRRRESSLGKNKRQRVIKKDAKDTKEEEEELPDLIAAANAGRRNPRLNAGDLVWVKYRKDWWPSYIKNVYPKERKFSIYFIACDQKAGIKVGYRNIKKLFIFDVPSFVNQNQEGFSSALHLCKLFHKLQESGNTVSAHDFFSLSPQDQVALLNPKMSSQKKTPPKKTVKSKSETKPKSKSAFKMPSGSVEKSHMSARDRSKLQSAIKARRADNLKLVRFMKSRQCLEHLWKIFEGEIPCNRHTEYQDEKLRKGLLWTGIGPFQLDEEDEQIMSVIEFLKEEIKTQRPDFQNGNDYAFRVWMPEAIKEALRVVKKVPASELDEALDKGYLETATEKKGDEAL